VQVLEVGPCERHPVEEYLDLGIRLSPDRLDLALVAEAAGLRFQKSPKLSHIAPPQNIAKLLAVRSIVGGHRRGSGGPVQADGDPEPGGQTVDEIAGCGGVGAVGVSVTRTPPPSLPIRL
jgi:hypothetical protein